MSRHFTDEQAELVAEWVIGRTTKELTNKINESFSKDLNEKQVLYYKKNHNLSSGLSGHFPKGHVPFNKGKKTPIEQQSVKTQFKKGRVPHNQMEIGAITVAEGYLRKKIAQPDTWEFVHKLKYIEYHGEIPKDHMIIFANGDKRDFSKENLVAITKEVNAYLNGYRMRYNDIDFTKTSIATVEMLEKIYAKQRSRIQ